MQWIKRYLAAASPYLPSDQRDELLAELEADLQDQLAAAPEQDERQLVAALGHPAAWAQKFHANAGLISQNLLPLYWLVLRWTLMSLIVLFAVLTVADAIASGTFAPILRLIQLTADVISTFVWLFTAITLGFYLLEQQVERLQLLSRWRPEQLPPIQPGWALVSRSDAAFGLVANLIFAALLLGLVPVTENLLLVSVLQHLPSLPLAVSLAAGLALAYSALHFWHCLHPQWTPKTLVANMTLNICCLALVMAVILSLTGDAGAPGAPGGLTGLSELWTTRVRWGTQSILAGIALVCCYELVRDLRRYWVINAPSEPQ